MFSASYRRFMVTTTVTFTPFLRLFSKRIQVPPESIQLSFVRSPGPGMESCVVLIQRWTKCKQGQYKSGGAI